MDSSLFLMPLVSRISSLGYIVRDGTKDKKDLTPRQAEMRLDGPPNLVSLLGYITFPCACVIGPFIEFRDFEAFIDEDRQYSKIPARSHEIVKKYVGSVISLAVSLFMPVLFFDKENLDKPIYTEAPFLLQAIYCYGTMMGCRCLYYFGWGMTDTALHASGITYSGKDFKRIESCLMIDVEFGTSHRSMVDGWNH
jgi:hypothetical protein